jgi:hypothetical protein
MNSLSAVYVVATTAAGTYAALRAATRLTFGDTSRIVLVAPRVRRLGGGLDVSAEAAPWTIDAHVYAARALNGPRANVHTCVCDDPADAVQRLVPQRAMVLVGERRRWWRPWPTAEERLASEMRRRGLDAVLVQQRGSQVVFVPGRFRAASDSDPRGRQWTGPSAVPTRKPRPAVGVSPQDPVARR